MKQFPGLVILALLLALSRAQSQDADDQYLRIFELIQQADSLNTNGQGSAALAKYQQAHTALRAFQKTYPTWNVKIVSYRLNYLAEKVGALSAPPEGGPASGTQPRQAQTPAGGGTQIPQVKLLEPGSEPRKVLRLHPKPGDKQLAGMTMKMAMDMKIGEMQNPVKLPAMNMTMEITVKNVTAEGDINYETVMGEASVADE